MRNIHTTNEMKEKGGKYLTFNLKQEEYGIAILKLKEIIGVTKITPIPKVPAFIKGVINLRDKVIPIIDLRLKFEMPEKEYTDRTCIMVLEMQTDHWLKDGNDNPKTDGQPSVHEIGVVVDSVSEVIQIKGDDISPAPSFSGSIGTEYISGMAKVDGSVKILLDIDKVLSNENLQCLQ